MDFSLTQVYVLSSTNTLPTTGSTNNLTPGQVGIFKPDYTPATSGTVAAQPYIYVGQGRPVDIPMVGSRRSDRIYASNIVEYYKITAEPIATLQITEVTGFEFQCEQDINLTLRLSSNYINTAFFNGLTRTVTVKTPCCNCGDNPCATVDPDAVVAALANKVNTEPMLSKYVTASVTGTGDSLSLKIYAKALDSYGNACVLPAFPYEYDRVSFWTFLYSGPDTTQDYVVYDRCDIPGSVQVLQRSTYVSGSSEQVKQVEKNFYSYDSYMKHIFFNPLYNGAVSLLAVDGTFYDQYTIKFRSPDQHTWAAKVAQDETVTFFVPTGTSAATNLAAVLTAFAGTPKDYSQTMLTTTTTTSTTSTTTTTTTTLIP